MTLEEEFYVLRRDFQQLAYELEKLKLELQKVKGLAVKAASKVESVNPERIERLSRRLDRLERDHQYLSIRVSELHLELREADKP